MSHNKNQSKVIIEHLNELDNLPHFPSALMKLEQLLSTDEGAHVDDVVGLIAQDPRMLAGVINLVNSVRYSPGYEVSNLGDAIGRIGVKDVRAMAHAINYKTAVTQKTPFSKKEFMQHALVSAFIGQELAKLTHLNSSEAFLCGLLHDLGIVLLSLEDREKYKRVIESIHGDVGNLILEEFNQFGASHTTLGGRLLNHWNFPKNVIMGVAGHHSPEKTREEYQSYAYLTLLTEFGAYSKGALNGIVSIAPEETDETFHSALEYLCLTHDLFDKAVDNGFQTAKDSGFI